MDNVINTNEKYALLAERTAKNFAEYNESLMELDKRELIEKAGEILAVYDAYNYFQTGMDMSPEEYDFYLQFQNPLCVLADSWYDMRDELYIIDALAERLIETEPELIARYPLTEDAAAVIEKSLRQFNGVNIPEFLGKIAEKVTIYNPESIKNNLKTLQKAAESDDPNDKRLIWQVCSFGSQLERERESFIRNTPEYNSITHYQSDGADTFGYIVEIAGYDGHTIWGNVYDAGDYVKYAEHIQNVSEPLESLTIIYSNDYGKNAAKTVNVGNDEFRGNPEHFLRGSGSVEEIAYHPNDKLRLAAVLAQERNNRKSLPFGDIDNHLEKLTAKLAEIRGEPELNKTIPEIKNTSAPQKFSVLNRLKEAGEEARANNERRALQNPAKTIKKEKEID